MSDRIIESVTGLQDPDNEFAFYCVGRNGVTGIIQREQNMGSYGILWFDVYINDGSKPMHSINALTGVTEIGYRA